MIVPETYHVPFCATHVLFRAIKASLNASFKWNVFVENVYVV